MDSGRHGNGGESGRDAGSSGSTPGKSQKDLDTLETLRKRILEVDELLVNLVGERRSLVLEVGEVKRRLGLPVLDPSREAAVVRRAAEMARGRELDDELVRDVIWRIIASAREEQRDP